MAHIALIHSVSVSLSINLRLGHLDIACYVIVTRRSPCMTDEKEETITGKELRYKESDGRTEVSCRSNGFCCREEAL